MRTGCLVLPRHLLTPSYPSNVEQVGVGVVQSFRHQRPRLHLALLLQAGALPDELHHRDGAGHAHPRYQDDEDPADTVQGQLVGVVAHSLVLGVALPPASPLLPPPVLQLVQDPLLLELQDGPVYRDSEVGPRGEGDAVTLRVQQLPNLAILQNSYGLEQVFPSLTWIRSQFLSMEYWMELLSMRKA